MTIFLLDHQINYRVISTQFIRHSTTFLTYSYNYPNCFGITFFLGLERNLENMVLDQSQGEGTSQNDNSNEENVTERSNGTQELSRD